MLWQKDKTRERKTKRSLLKPLKKNGLKKEIRKPKTVDLFLSFPYCISRCVLIQYAYPRPDSSNISPMKRRVFISTAAKAGAIFPFVFASRHAGAAPHTDIVKESFPLEEITVETLQQ